MTDEPKPPPGHKALKEFLAKLAKVPKREIDEREAEWQRSRKSARKKAG